MRNSKLHKYLKQEVKDLFDEWLNGELLRTKNEIKDYSEQFEGIDLDNIRYFKKKLKKEHKDVNFIF